MAVVAIDKLTKIYDRGHAPAADNVSLNIAHGEFMVLLGPSGCGKTTTLRMVAGLESISSGTVSIDGRIVNQVPAKDRDIAMVFQSYALYPHMSVKDNLAFGLKRRAVDRAEIERRVASVAGILGLAELLGRKPHALSGGQRQRVALGRAIVRDPKVFLFDEPLSNLDAALRVSTRGEISALHRRLGATMIYVTHDQVEAMTMGTRICIMNGGRVAQVGPPLEVYHHPANTFVASFLGNPPMTLLPAVAMDKSGGRCLKVGDSEIELPRNRRPQLQPGSQVNFGIRPEHVAQRPARMAQRRRSRPKSFARSRSGQRR
jgi:multiple sugar transport system ATP-binding protein